MKTLNEIFEQAEKEDETDDILEAVETMDEINWAWELGNEVSAEDKINFYISKFFICKYQEEKTTDFWSSVRYHNKWDKAFDMLRELIRVKR